jgi:hypothetical protein
MAKLLCRSVGHDRTTTVVIATRDPRRGRR